LQNPVPPLRNCKEAFSGIAAVWREGHADTAVPALAAETALAKDWLSPEEDSAWGDLQRRCVVLNFPGLRGKEMASLIMSSWNPLMKWLGGLASLKPLLWTIAQ
jgi:hypothetical protein